jgi:L-arabinose 1-dehydrogenase
MRVGMIGLGAIAPYYDAALRRSHKARLTSVCDVRPDRMAAYANQGVALHNHHNVLLTSGNVDAVVVNVPNDHHFEIVRAALTKGKHVCCEKPLTTTLSQARELVRLAEAEDRTLFTAFHRRYNVNFIDARRSIRESNISMVTMHYLERIEDHAGPDGWYLDAVRCGGGCIADNGPNVFDTLRALLGPLNVTQTFLDTSTSGAERLARLELRSWRGIRATAVLDWAYPYGERKDLVIGLTDGSTVKVDLLRGFPAFKSSLWHEYEAVLEDFLAHIGGATSNSADAIESVRLVEEAYLRRRVT